MQKWLFIIQGTLPKRFKMQGNFTVQITRNKHLKHTRLKHTRLKQTFKT